MKRREAGSDRRGDDETDPTRNDDRDGKSSASASSLTYAAPVEWTREQSSAINKALDWLDDRNGAQEFRLLGAAGTGKSTVAVEIGRRAGAAVAYCALSGKAASRLIERGVPRDRCSTIHSLIYRTHYDEDRNKYFFTTRNRSELAHLDLIVVDEASMVGTRVARDLRSFGRRLLTVGDDFQLPPPTDEKIAPLLQGRVNVRLQQIHRQALNNPILAVADAIRRNNDWRRFVDDDRVRVVEILRTEEAARLDAIICGTNARRKSINRKMRAHLGFAGVVPHVGEVVICLKNDYDAGIYNGEVFEVIKVHRRRDCPAVDLELSNLQYPAKASVTVPLSFFEDGEPPERRTVPPPWQALDYAYALTCHKAQASEWDSVAVVDESPLLRRECKTTADKITFLPTLATIVPLASDYASAAGGHPTITVFDELWAYTSERSRRLGDEMVPVPTRKISLRLTVTYAGFEGESELLHDLFKRGVQQPEVAPNLRAGDGLLMFWSHEPVAPWQDEKWLAEMRRSLRPNQYLRMIENRFVSSESTFIDMPSWDACVDATLGTLPFSRSAAVWVGIDASVKRDSTAVVAVTWDRSTQKVRLAWHRVFQPSAERPLDFEMTIEQSLIELAKRYQIKKVFFDPYQMQATAQRLARERLPIEEFPQTVGNLTEASQNLFELIKSRSLVAYPDESMRRSIAQAVAVETTRGWRIAKDKQSHKIDVVVALAQACLAVIREQRAHTYDTSLSWVSGPDDAADKPDYAAERLKAFIRSNTLFF